MSKIEFQEVGDGDLKVFLDGEIVFYDHQHNLLYHIDDILTKAGLEVSWREYQFDQDY